MSASVAKYKKVKNIDTGEIFESVMSAAEKQELDVHLFRNA